MKHLETEGGVVGARGWGRGKEERVSNGHIVSTEGDERFWVQMVTMLVRQGMHLMPSNCTLKND